MTAAWLTPTKPGVLYQLHSTIVISIYDSKFADASLSAFPLATTAQQVLPIVLTILAGAIFTYNTSDRWALVCCLYACKLPRLSQARELKQIRWSLLTDMDFIDVQRVWWPVSLCSLNRCDWRLARVQEWHHCRVLRLAVIGLTWWVFYWGLLDARMHNKIVEYREQRIYT